MKEREEQVSIVQGRVLPEGVQRVVCEGRKNWSFECRV
jgi:hypothetical protein